MKVIRKFQDGGAAMSAQQEQQMGQPVKQGGQPTQGPEEQIMAIAQDIIQQMGPDAAALLAQIIMEMLQGAAQPQQPTFQRRGGSLGRKN
jgi:hypothetical protein